MSTKKGKDYSTFQYNYDIKDPSTKRGWRTVKEGVPRFLSGAIADAISEGKPIREVLAILGKEARGEKRLLDDLSEAVMLSQWKGRIGGALLMRSPQNTSTLTPKDFLNTYRQGILGFEYNLN